MARQDRIDGYEKKIAELQKRLKEERAKEAELQKKARSQRLIKVGALVEKYAGHEVTDLAAFETWLQKVLGKGQANENHID